MMIDGTRVTSGTTIEAQICIIGGGVSGLVLAAELCRKGRDVLLLESGTFPTDTAGAHQRAQELNDGICSGDPYAGLTVTRHRGIGGTALLWNTPTHQGLGAKYSPLDAVDFEARWPDGAAWPFSFSELRPWYERAQATCGLGPFVYEAALDESPGTHRLAIGDGVETRLYHMGSRGALINPLLDLLKNAPNARILTGATVVKLQARAKQTKLQVATEHSTFEVRATRVILAAGAIENARQLLIANEQGSVPKDQSGWLGRGFMEHPRARSITLHPTNAAQYYALSFFDTRVVRGGSSSMILGRLALSAEAIRSGDLLNASATLLPNVQPTRDRIREVMMRRTGFRGFTRWLPESGHGWSRHRAPHHVFDGFTVLLNLEQPPRRENAVVLSTKRDRFGMALPELQWRWHADDHTRLERVRTIFANALQRADMGRVTLASNSHPDPNAHHHAGTTRMHNDAAQGVVDGDGRVFGTESLFVAGASMFPAAGFANPTLTIVATALRLADRLHNEL